MEVKFFSNIFDHNVESYGISQIEELVCPPPPVAPRSPGKRPRRLSDSGSTIFDEDYEGLHTLTHLKYFFVAFSICFSSIPTEI